MNNEIEITSVHEVVADKRQVCEIRFDCTVQMHDVAFKEFDTALGRRQSKTPQWFRAYSTITLESIKHDDPYMLGMRLKDMFHQLKHTIEQYEQHR